MTFGIDMCNYVNIFGVHHVLETTFANPYYSIFVLYREIVCCLFNNYKMIVFRRDVLTNSGVTNVKAPCPVDMISV